MINYSLFDTYTLAQNLIKAIIQNIISNNAQDLTNLSRPIPALESILHKDWTVLSYKQAKAITHKNEIGLSTEEEKFLTVCNTLGSLRVASNCNKLSFRNHPFLHEKKC
jgi:aspartyl/asparaginyl-tRNA synthetase